MLIWKVIAANPGITRAEIWEQVEHSIPDGYAIRVYTRYRAVSGSKSRVTADSVTLLRMARGHVLSLALKNLRRAAVSFEGYGDERQYVAVQEPRYRGNLDAVDETGTKAAEHMAVADALRRMERLLATPSAEHKYGRKNCEAIAILVKALRAKDRVVS